MTERLLHRTMPRPPITPDVLQIPQAERARLVYPSALWQSDAIGAPLPKIAVVGVGGGGVNALNHLGSNYGAYVRRIALNTDAQSLGRAEADAVFCLGESLTRGQGTGGAPEGGERAAEISRHHIASLLRGQDVVFILAGLGGGTGTGAAPVVAQIARELGALTIGMATTPFAFEGGRRRQIAQIGLARLAPAVDALVVLPNDRLVQVTNQDQRVNDAFVRADAAMRQGIAGIVEIVTTPGLINVDFADVRAVLRQAGSSLLSVAEASGVDRAAQAAHDAMSGGWLGASMRGARRVLLHLTCSPDVTLFEVADIAARVADHSDPQADCVFGAVIDPELTDTLRITMLAGGLPTNVTP